MMKIIILGQVMSRLQYMACPKYLLIKEQVVQARLAIMATN